MLDLIRGLPVRRADEVLQFTDREASPASSARCSPAPSPTPQHNDEQDPEELYVKACFADEGPTLKRFTPRARGRAGRINKRTATSPSWSTASTTTASRSCRPARPAAPSPAVAAPQPVAPPPAVVPVSSAAVSRGHRRSKTRRRRDRRRPSIDDRGDETEELGRPGRDRPRRDDGRRPRSPQTGGHRGQQPTEAADEAEENN